jgi:hypothetical protein
MSHFEKVCIFGTLDLWKMVIALQGTCFKSQGQSLLIAKAGIQTHSQIPESRFLPVNTVRIFTRWMKKDTVYLSG